MEPRFPPCGGTAGEFKRPPGLLRCMGLFCSPGILAVTPAAWEICAGEDSNGVTNPNKMGILGVAGEFRELVTAVFSGVVP